MLTRSSALSALGQRKLRDHRANSDPDGGTITLSSSAALRP